MTDDAPRQRIERIRGSRRARLTAAPGTTTEPDAGDDEAFPTSGPNDDRLRQDVPPHY